VNRGETSVGVGLKPAKIMTIRVHEWSWSNRYVVGAQ
jgi:hypothetical protein